MSHSLLVLHTPGHAANHLCLVLLLDDWVCHAYDNVPPRMWPVAKRSLMAHVARIDVNLSLND